jgi:hypothetical protein
MRAHIKIMSIRKDGLRKTMSNEPIISQNNQGHHFLGFMKVPQTHRIDELIVEVKSMFLSVEALRAIFECRFR